MSTLYMFPPQEGPPEDADLVAAEYVLGVLSSGDAASVRLRADTDDTLRRAIAAWQARLAPLTESLAPVEPPPALWAALAIEIGLMPAETPDSSPEEAETEQAEAEWAEPLPEAPPAPHEPPPDEPVLPPLPAPVTVTYYAAPEPEPPEPAHIEPVHIEPAAVEPVHAGPEHAEPEPLLAPLPVADSYEPDELPAVSPAPPTAAAKAAEQPPPVPWLRRLAVWRVATGLSLLLAACLAVVAALIARPAPPPPPVRAIAAMGPVSAPAPLFLAEAGTDGHLKITALATIAVPAGRDLQLWIVPPGSTAAPASLGVMPSSGLDLALGTVPAEGSQLLISMEVTGGSRSGKLSGPVLYGGTLANH